MKTMIFAVTLLLLTGASAQQSTILVSKANYGQNCKLNDPQGDYTQPMKEACDGRSNCSFDKIGAKGDHCPGEKKDFDWVWTCTGQNGQKEGHIDGEASSKTASLYCPF